ncbi:hypothetical protein CHARACLAT_004057 [Characodon lateralis]|uniref:Uncharacterized protein n=1 Tax=Characodon lateralis TaxID=208331 RepID=A0ABU7DQ11_9TELE|nr:hypothetical protein [Characodon lateralis]
MPHCWDISQETIGISLRVCKSPAPADDLGSLLTTLTGLNQDNDKSAYRQEVDRLVHWCSENRLDLNPRRTVERMVENPQHCLLRITSNLRIYLFLITHRHCLK